MDLAPDLPLVSATQIDLWRDCQRKWGFKYVERLQTPTHPAAALGTEVQDTQIDPYLATGREFDFSRPSGEIALALKPLLMLPGTPGLRLRRKFLIPSPSGLFGYQGEFDLWAPDSACVPGLEGGAPLLGDIKTTGNLNYAKTGEALLTDVQAELYSMVSMVEDNVDVLDLVWFYTRTRGAHRAQRSHVRVKASHVVEQFERIDAIGRELVTIKQSNPKVSELPPNVRMCEAYGGCPFRYKCNLSPSVQAAAVNREAVMNSPATADFLATLRKGAPDAAPPPVPTVTPPVSNPFAVPPAVALPAWMTAPVDPRHAQQAAPPLALVTPAINPPEAALPPAPPVGAAAPVASVAETAKRGPGRPKKASVEVAGAVGTVLEAKAELGAGPAAVHLVDLEGLVARMRTLGVKRLQVMDGKLYEVALFDQAGGS